MVREWADTGMIHQGLTCFDKGKWRLNHLKMGRSWVSPPKEHVYKW
jgi:hypothetical protein